jgi:hypothetical protein
VGFQPPRGDPATSSPSTGDLLPGSDLCWAAPLAKLAVWALSLMYIDPKLAIWAIRLEARAISEVTIAIGCEDREESSR